MTYDYVIRYIPLYKAALEDDWDAAEKFFKDADEEAPYAQITYYWETPLHIAVGTNSSHRFVENLIEKIKPVEKLLIPNYWNNNAMHYAAKVGNTRAAKLLVKKLPDFPQIPNKSGHTALKLAAWHAQKEILWYLLSVTKDDQVENGPSPYTGVDGADLLTLSVTADFYDVALYLVEKYPDLVTTKDRESRTGLQTLAAKPDAFRSGCRLWFWQDFIYSCIPVKPENAFHYSMEGVRANYLQNMSRWGSSKDKDAHVLNWLKAGCFQINVVLWSVLQKGKLAPPHRLSTVTGAALQMQRELQWFKEVEKFVQPSFKEAKNSKEQTPKMVFTEAHAKLVEDGEKWMKDTATSSSVVAALIITVAFAAAFTIPGGNNNDGTPLFLYDKIFMLFAISDAIALFSSATSVLMFLAILTSRYAEEDFLNALPKRLIIGLISLFLSIATTMIAFSATLGIVLRKEITWIAIPVSLMACLPITLFALLQFPLLVEVVNSTYGRSIFHRESKLLLH